MIRILASFLAFVALLSAQSAAPAKPGKVEGTVVNSVSNDPVKKADVMLQSLQGGVNYFAVSDAGGHFHFDSVAPGQYQATAYREGFTPGNQFGPPMKPLTISTEQQVSDVVVKLVPFPVVNGHVLDEDGEPLEYVQVLAMRYAYTQGFARLLQPAGFASSNDLGEFQFLDLEPGRYYFTAISRGHLERLPANTKNRGPEQAYPQTFYPNAVEAGQGTAIVVAAGDQINGIDFRLRKAPAFRIRGKAVDGSTGEPIRNRMVHLETNGNRFFFANTRVRANGTFDLPAVASGVYEMFLQMRDGPPIRQAIQVGDHDVNDVVIVTHPQLEISVSVQFEGNPLSGRKDQIRFNLISSRGEMSSMAQVSPDGNLTLKAAPAEYQLYASCDAGAYLKSARFGDQDLISGRIDLTGQSGGTLNLLCATDVSQIQGSVQDENGEPAPQAVITVNPDEEHQHRLDLYHVLTSDRNGHFDYRDFAPGNYKVFAWQGSGVDPQMLQSAEFRKAFDSRAEAITVAPGGKASVQLKMISAADIEAEKNKLP